MISVCKDFTLKPACIEEAPALWELLARHRHHFLDDYQTLEKSWLLESLKQREIFSLYFQHTLAGLLWVSDIYPERRHGSIHLLTEPRYLKLAVKNKLFESILRFVFEQLGIQKIKATVSSNQKMTLKLVKKLGFILAGHFKNEGQVFGQPVDTFIFEKTATHNF